MKKILYAVLGGAFVLAATGIIYSAQEPQKITTVSYEAENADMDAGTEPFKAATAEGQQKHKVPAEVVQVANEGFPYVPDDHIPKEWGVTIESLRSATLGEPFLRYKITPAILRNYRKGDTAESLLSETKTDIWCFPVLIDKEIKFRIEVGKRGKSADWRFVGFGSGRLEIELNKIMRQWPKSEGYNPIFMVGWDRGDPYGWFFTVPEKGPYNLTPILTMSGMEKTTPYSDLDTVDNVVKWLKPKLEEVAR